MSHLNRRAVAAKAAETAANLSTKLNEISKLDRWFTTRLIDLEKSAKLLLSDLTDILNMTNAEEPVLTLPVKSQPVQTNVDPGVTFPAGSRIRITSRGAHIQNLPGFLGGTFRNSWTGSPVRREPNQRAFPSKIVLKAWNPTSGTITVERAWYLAPEQEDLRNYLTALGLAPKV